MKRISGAEFPLSKIFSSDFEFVIPSYQRPYAWGEAQTSELLDDLLAFAEDDSEEGYFLGSIVLIKTDDAPLAEVIDGQQRLTTLTILLAAAATAHDDANKDDTKPYILEPGKKMEGIQAKPRLALRGRDRDFFAKYVQNLRLRELIELDTGSMENESRLNILRNARYLLTNIEKRLPTPEAVEGFINFLLTRCYLVAVSTPSQESAFRVFSVMNSRGLDLQHTDIIKADMIGKIAGEQARQKYNDKWEDLEVELTRTGFGDLFSHIRMIHAKEKSKRTLLEDFRTIVLPKYPNPQRFIDDVLEPFAESLIDIRSADFSSSTNAEEINHYLRWLNRIDNSDWVPSAMLFMTKSRNKPKVLARFLKLLERLAAYLHACRYNVNERIEAYASVVTDIEKATAPDDMASLQFDRKYSKEFRDALNGDIYLLTPRRRNYLLLRLDSFISDGAATYDPGILTIEHVLPQTVAEGSEWEEWWPDEDEREQWVHRLANLVPLNKKRNSAAQNFDFGDKRDIYFKGTRNVSSYALTTQVLAKDDWTPKYLKSKQKTLLDAMMAGWELDA